MSPSESSKEEQKYVVKETKIPFNLRRERKSVSSKNVINSLYSNKKKCLKSHQHASSITPHKIEQKESKFKIALEKLRKQQNLKYKKMKVLDKPEIPSSIYTLKDANNQRSRCLSSNQTFEFLSNLSPNSMTGKQLLLLRIL